MFSLPGITQLRDQAVGDMLLATGLPTLLRRSPLRGMAYAQAGLAYGQYGHLKWIARQSVPFTATGLFLESWAALVGVTREPATAATGSVTFTNTTGTPVTVPSGTVLRRSDGAAYATAADCPVPGNGIAGTAVVCTTAGSAYSLTPGTVLALAGAVFGIVSIATATPNVPGTDPELDASLRSRMLLRWAEPPEGGSEADYLRWALAVPGVTRAWVLPLGMGAGTVVVYTMWDEVENTPTAPHGGFPQGTAGVASRESRDLPASGDLLAVANALYPERPTTALVYSVAPTPYPVAFAIHAPAGVPVALQPQVDAAIDAVFVENASVLGTEIEAAPFNTAISGIAGMPAFTLPLSPIQAPVGALPMRGAVTYV